MGAGGRDLGEMDCALDDGRDVDSVLRRGRDGVDLY